MASRMSLTRRQFLRLGLATGSAALLAACTAAPAAQPTAAPKAASGPSGAPAAPAGPRGDLRMSISSLGTAETWLAWREAGIETNIVQQGFYDFLLDNDPKTGELRPGLAERWVPEEGAKVWRFFLRKGVQFDQGQGELTAADVKFTFERIATKENVSSFGKTLNVNMERVEAVNPYEVVVYLKKPDASLPTNVSVAAFNVGIVSKKYVESVGDDVAATKPVGSGPFRLVEHQRRVVAKFEAMGNHWRKTPGFKTLTLNRVDEPAARLASLKAGEVDVAEIPASLRREAKAAGFAFAASRWSANYHTMLGGMIDPGHKYFDPNVPWVTNPKDPASAARALKVRQALNLAVNKQEMLNTIFEGNGGLMVVPFVPPDSPYSPPSATSYPFDVERAKQLLAEAGYPGGKGFPTVIARVQPIPGRPESADVTQAVAGYWEKNLGLQVKREMMDWAGVVPYLSSRNMAGAIWTLGVQTRLSEPVSSMDGWVPSWGQNDALGDMPEVDALYKAVTEEMNPEKRTLNYQALFKYMYDNYLTVPTVGADTVYVYNPKKVATWPLLPGLSYIHNYAFIDPV